MSSYRVCRMKEKCQLLIKAKFKLWEKNIEAIERLIMLLKVETLNDFCQINYVPELKLELRLGFFTLWENKILMFNLLKEEAE